MIVMMTYELSGQNIK